MIATPTPPAEETDGMLPAVSGSASSKPSRYAVEPMTGLEVYKIGSEAIITLQPSTGYVAVSCPWHDELNGCHWWGARGPLSLHEFLLGLDRGYTLGKLFAYRSLDEYDEDTTKAVLRDVVKKGRRSGDWSKDQARDLWDQIEAADGDQDIARIEGMECPYEYIHHRPKNCAGWFWDNVWAAFTDHLRASLQNVTTEARQ
jgi:hypothetical protein